MKKIETKLKGELAEVVITDAACDICGKSCMKTEGKAKVFEGMEIKADWGYYSKKDGERWRAVICEDCVDLHLKNLIKFEIL